MPRRPTGRGRTARDRGRRRDVELPGVLRLSGVELCLVNDEVVHGIPGSRVIEDGDIVSVDCGAIVDGWHGDSAGSMIAGTPRGGQDTHLVEQTRLALWAGIAALATANRLDDVAGADRGCRRRCTTPPTRGVMWATASAPLMHQPPDVPNYRTRRASSQGEAGPVLGDRTDVGDRHGGVNRPLGRLDRRVCGRILVRRTGSIRSPSTRRGSGC